MTETKHLRPIKTYVVRGGRLTGSQQKAINELWSLYGLDKEQGVINSAEVFGNDNPLVFEIGFGMGDSLVQMGKEHPQQNFIGVDVHPPGIGNLLKKVTEERVTNIRVFQDDAKEILQECIADNSLATVQIFFPDPWHKKRHHKRRLIQTGFMEELLPKIKKHGVIHLATDWQNYAEQMMEVLSECKQLKNQFGANNFATKHDRPTTKFQRRGERLGHGVWDLVFKKK